MSVTTVRLQELPELSLRGPAHLAPTVRGAWTAVAQGVTRRLGLVLPEPVWQDGPECAAYCRQTRLASIEPGSHSVGDLVELVVAKADCLLSLAGTAGILEELKGRAPIYSEEMERLKIPASFVHSMLRLLLQERVSVQDIEQILSTVIERWKAGATPEALLEPVRERMADWMCQAMAGANRELAAVTLSPRMEAALKGKLKEFTLELDEEPSNRLLDLLHEILSNLEEERPVVLCSSPLRLAFWRLAARGFPNLPVLAWSEVAPDYGVNVVATLEQKL